jgi:ABC transport system ATP-binding/permease protein
VRHGTRLEVAYFDQLRDTLDPRQSVVDAVAEGARTGRSGHQTKHVIRLPAGLPLYPRPGRAAGRALSGGERNRLLLARLFTRPSTCW